MAGIVSTLFGRDMPTADQYANAIGRGLSPVGLFSGMVDLAALPFTLTGVINPDQVVGGSKQMERLGVLPPNPEGVGPETVEAISSLFTPMGAARGLNRALGVADSFAPGARSGAPAVPLPQAKRTENLRDLAQMERMAQRSKYKPRVAEIERRTSAAIQQEAERFTPQATKLKDDYLGKKMQTAFSKFMERKENAFKLANEKDFAKALAGGRDHITIPPSEVATIELREWIRDKMSRAGTSKDEKLAYRRLYRDARRMLMGDMSLGVMKDRLAYNVRELAEKDANNPFSKVTADWTKEAQRQVDKALKTRLDEASLVVPEAADLVKARNNYMVRRNELDDLKDQTLVRFFGTKDKQELTPEKIVERLNTMTGTERDFFVKVADQVYPNLSNQLRRTLFDKMVDSGIPKGQSTMSSGFDQQKFLEYYEKLKPEMKEFITPKDPTAKAEFDDLILSAKQSLNTFSGGKEGVSAGALIGEGLGAGAVGVRSTVTRGIAGIPDWWRDRGSVFNRLYGLEKQQTGNRIPGDKTAAAIGLGADAGRGVQGWHQSFIDDDDDIPEDEAAQIGLEPPQAPIEAPVGSVPSPGQENPATGLSGPSNGVSVDPSYLEGWDLDSKPEVDPSYLEGW